MKTSDRKEYAHQWYLRNKERATEKGRARYLANREHFLEYQRERTKKGINKTLSKKRRDFNLEKYRDKESLSAHRVASEVAKRRREEQKEKYLAWMEKTPAPLSGIEWNEGEIEYLQNHYKEKTILELAIKLGRTWGATSRKMNLLRLTKVPQRIKTLLRRAEGKIA